MWEQALTPWSASRAVSVVVVVFGSMLVMPIGHGEAIACGDQIAHDIVLNDDVGPCVAGGLVVVGNDLTIDLAGHRVFGSAGTGDGAGITLRNVFGASVKHGTVTGFDAGVVIDGGGANLVRDVRAFANVGTGAHLGDGVLIRGSSSNLIERSEISGNGPYSGVSVVAPRSDPADPASPRVPAVGNKLLENSIRDNRVQIDASSMSDAGVRLETGTVATNVRSNRISYNGLDGIVVFPGSTANRLRENVVSRNGHHAKGHRLGDGIRVFGTSAPGLNRVERNRLAHNAGYGTAVSSAAFGNVIVRNDATRNDAGGFYGPNATCQANRWRLNRGGPFLPSCTAGRR